MYKAPKTITNHPGVKDCDNGHAMGSDYKHDVLLMRGWVFENGRMEGTRCGLFNTVAQFLEAKPVRK